MSIVVECPGGHTISVKDKYAGKKGKCPRCGIVVQVPNTDFDHDELHEWLIEEGDDSAPVYQVDESALESSGVSLIDPSSLSNGDSIHQCPKCSKKVYVPANNLCPNCGAFYTYWA